MMIYCSLRHLSVFVLNSSRIFDWSVRTSQRDSNADQQRYKRRAHRVQVIMNWQRWNRWYQLGPSALVLKVKSRPVTSSQKSLGVGREIRSTVVSVAYTIHIRNKTYHKATIVIKMLQFSANIVAGGELLPRIWALVPLTVQRWGFGANGDNNDFEEDDEMVGETNSSGGIHRNALGRLDLCLS